MICPSCNSENRENAKFCDECGFPLTGKLAQAAMATGAENSTAADMLAGEATHEPGSFQAVAYEEEAQPVEEQAEELQSVQVEEIEPVAAVEEDAVEETSVQEEEKDPNPTIEIPAVIQVPEISQEAAVAAGAAAAAAAAVGAGAGAVAGAGAANAGETTRMGSWMNYGNADPGKTADLSGLERSMDGQYIPPARDWRNGTIEMDPINVNEDTRNRREFRAPEQPKGKGNVKLVLGAVAGVLALVAVIAAATWFMEVWGGHSVPDVKGMSQADATLTLQQKGFKVTVKTAKSDDIEGIAMLTDPNAGGRAKEGAEVILYISESRSIPKIVGKDINEAKKLMEAEGYTNVKYQEVRSDDKEGVVLKVSPEEGQKTKAAVSIVVEYTVPYTVPDTSNMTWQQAVEEVDKAGYTASVAYSYSETIPEGTLVGTNPSAGEKLASGSVVQVLVTKNRATELKEATTSLLAPKSNVNIGGVNYAINSLDAVSYVEGETTSYTINATPFETYTFFGIETVTRYGDPKTISGTITWTANNTVASGNPSIQSI